MARIVIEVPDNVADSLRTLSAAKGVPFEKFCLAAFIAGLNKKLRKGFDVK